MLISGRCQCGNISFILEWLPDPIEIPARACSCSFCATHAGVWTSCPSGKLQVRIKNPAQVRKHSFATETAQFHVCEGCGDVPLVTSQIEGQTFAVVNTHALQGIAPALLKHQSASFDGESAEARLARRRQHWIADVHIREDPV